MTHIAISLNRKKARILTDTLAIKEEKIVSVYKATQLKRHGVVITGRGARELFDKIAEKLEKYPSFDEIIPNLRMVCREAHGEFVGLKKFFPPEYTIDKIVTDSVVMGGEWLARFNFDLYCVGYSQKKKTMGLACLDSCYNHKVNEFYKPGFLFCMAMEPVIEYGKEIGHKPDSDQELAEGFRRSFAFSKNRLDISAPVTAPLGGKIQMTSIYPDGEISVRTVGPVVRGSKLKVLKPGDQLSLRDQLRLARKRDEESLKKHLGLSES